MNIPKYSLENRKVIYFFLAILLIGGVISFFKLPKKEDAPFVIKTAVLVTQYPGANPHEVEKLITEPIEREIQSMTDVYQIKSESYFGLSKISIELQPTIDPDYMPVKWDELRRKVANIQPKLPSGASTITVNDDFGDVYGIYYALTADEGFSYTDLRDIADVLAKIGDNMLDIYYDKVGGKKRELKQLMKDETWFKASEAKEFGLIDTVLETEKKVNALFDLSMFANAPEEIKTEIEGRDLTLRELERALRDAGASRSYAARVAAGSRDISRRDSAKAEKLETLINLIRGGK